MCDFSMSLQWAAWAVSHCKPLPITLNCNAMHVDIIAEKSRVDNECFSGIRTPAEIEHSLSHSL